jgi:rRNA maturation endonuclease Nob1
MTEDCCLEIKAYLGFTEDGENTIIEEYEFKCSECKGIWEINGYYEIDFNYCPACGTKFKNCKEYKLLKKEECNYRFY